MEQLIEPVDRDELMAELKEEFLLRPTNKAGNFVYIFRAEQAPLLMREVGRLREEAFRAAGGGTGNSVDIDQYDIDPEGYYQLIVWDPAA
ncbi:MAG: hemolysin, partial [Mucinivorans sp.]